MPKTTPTEGRLVIVDNGFVRSHGVVHLAVIGFDEETHTPGFAVLCNQPLDEVEPVDLIDTDDDVTCDECARVFLAMMLDGLFHESTDEPEPEVEPEPDRVMAGGGYL